MPQYRFKCKDCNTEQILSMSYNEYDAKKYKCEKCGSHNLERIYAAIPVKYNATGFTSVDISDALSMF